MRVAHGVLDVGVVERLLYHRQIAGLAQELGREVMSIVVKSEPDDTGPQPQPTPVRLHAVIGERISFALDAPLLTALADIGENQRGMMLAQRPQKFTNLRRDRHGDALPTFAELAYLARVPVDLRPFQQAFCEPQPGGAGK